MTYSSADRSKMFSAKSVAIVGASPKGRWPMEILRNLKKAYKGKISLINPNYQEIENYPCYPNLAALPDVPEELLILIPTRAVLGTLEEATKLGTKSATVLLQDLAKATILWVRNAPRR